MTENFEPKYEDLSTKEWIVTNGIGGYASSTIIGANTRRYHGLLVASLNPPTERIVVVSKIEETIYYEGQNHDLSTNAYANAIHPQGYHNFRGFERSPLPAAFFAGDNWSIQKTVWMVDGSNTTIIEYTNTSQVPYLLKLSPHYSNRDYHALLNEQANFEFRLNKHKKSHMISAYYGAPPVYFAHSSGKFSENRYWHKQLQYAIDKERGQGYTEDTYCLGQVEHQLQPGQSIFLIFSMEEAMVEKDPAALKNEEIKRLAGIAPDIKNEFLRDLIISGDQFLVQRRSTESYSVIAGYHWFTDWGRDAMISIRGLSISTGKKEVARSVISTFLCYLKQGIIPNRFPDYKGDVAEYNTVDATLWLFVALYDYDRRFKDTEFLEEVYPKLCEIIVHHLKGTMHNIRVTDKGLLAQGVDGVQLTWMDARINDMVFTPRQGCPVEINALWYNALKIYEYCSERLGKEVENNIIDVRGKVEENFLRTFWNRDGYLYDVVTPERSVDTALRPNQVYVLSLPFSLLPEKESRFVLESIRKNLLTDYGLRTLYLHHPDFKPVYAGDLWTRDAAYHQGTVWPFLSPEYFLAYLRLNNFSDEAKRAVEDALQPLIRHFYEEQCLHGISEIFDGLDPREGKGCMHQAWSVANLIYLIMEGGLQPEKKQRASKVFAAE